MCKKTRTVLGAVSAMVLALDVFLGVVLEKGKVINDEVATN